MGNILIENGKAVGALGSPIPANLVSYNGSNVETALDEINAEITKHNFGTSISIKDYGDNNPYTFPSDGFIRFVCGNNPTGTVARYYVNNTNVFQINVSKLSFADVYTLYVKKGMVFVNDTHISPYFLDFYPLT